ncbi:MAG: hypothetical protein GY820_48310 [Gammaproteobacteria bacterium]|nr:hypothetical protein [Gammaproteobacteria bacterium]
MNTTLNKIREYSPCEPSWEKLLLSLHKTKADDEPVSFRYLLDTLGIKDAIWCLRTLTYKEQCLFLADVAESVLPIFEKHSDDPAPRDCVQAIRDYECGLISEAELQAAASAASAANAANAAYAGYACAAANSAACAAACATDAAAYTAVYAAACAAYAAKDDKWQEIEVLFVKHFVDERQ